MRIFALITLSFFLVNCGSENTDTQTNVVQDKLDPDTLKPILTSPDSSIVVNQYTAEIFETTGLGWGYKIYDNGTLFINQPHIPAIQGNKGFSTKDQAQITADFAIFKMEQGFVPPTISPKELDSLGVLK